MRKMFQRRVLVSLLAGGIVLAMAPPEADAGKKLKKAISKAKEKVKEKVKEKKEKVKEKVTKVKEKVKEKVTKVKEKVKEKVTKVKEKVKEVVDKVGDKLQNAIDKVKNSIKSGINKSLKPLISKVKDYVLEKVVTPAVQALTTFLMGKIEDAAAGVAEKILGRTEKVQGQLDQMESILSDFASGKFDTVNAKLAAYKTSIDTLGQDVVNQGLDYALSWLRDKVVAFVLDKAMPLLDKVFDWAYNGVSTARNSIQGLVGSVPFGGGALAMSVGVAVDEGWKALKDKVQEFVTEQVNRLANLVTSKAKDVLSGVAGKGGGLIQKVVDALKTPLQKIADKIKTHVEPVLAKSRAIVVLLEKVRDKQIKLLPAQTPAAAPAKR